MYRLTPGDKIVGHKTMLDGSHVPLTAAEAGAIWDHVEGADAKRRESMPDSLTALHALFDAWQRLKDEGWREGMYCPKDGSEFAVVQLGSTGIFSAWYAGNWPDGRVYFGDFAHHVEGLLWKSVAALTEAERAVLERCDEAERIMHGREVRALLEQEGK